MSLCINPSCPNPQNLETQLFCISCGSELLLEGRYRVTCKLGSGGFGKTYEVRDSEGTLQVLKVLINNDSKYVELFQREAQILTRLRHQGIPKAQSDGYFLFYSSNKQQPLHCLVMEKIEGLNLQQYIQKRGNPIDEKSAIRWLAQLVNILEAVHSQNFFHRDIKPSNIMLKVDGQLVLIDFGTAREITETFVTKQASGQVTGVISAGYTPSEQFNGQAVPQSDFFALGRTFIFLLTSKDPNQFYNFQTDELSWREAVPHLSQQFGDFIDRLMARFPHQRPQNTQEIWQQLEQLTDTLEQTQTGSPPTQQITSARAASTAYTPNTAPINPATEPFVASTSSNQSKLDPNFIKRCKQELAELIGPISAIICQRTLAKNPGLSPTELVESIAKQIPNPKQASDFKKRLLS
ncbi:MAG: serine/threonine-protein kinase [Coleofasciculaceae cyanobacterium]